MFFCNCFDGLVNWLPPLGLGLSKSSGILKMRCLLSETESFMLKVVVVLATVAGPPVGGSGSAVSLLLLLVLLLFCLLRYCCCFWSLIMVLLLLLLLCLVTVCMCLVALGVKKICSTSHPGGNQVDGLPPASVGSKVRRKLRIFRNML